MRNRELLAAVAGLFFACVLPCVAQDSGYWRAASTNANAITGDIVISGSKLTLDFYDFPLSLIRTLTTNEVAAAFDADVNAGGGPPHGPPPRVPGSYQPGSASSFELFVSRVTDPPLEVIR